MNQINRKFDSRKSERDGPTLGQAGARLNQKKTEARARPVPGPAQPDGLMARIHGV